MDIQNLPAPPTPWSSQLLEPTIDPTVYIHPLTNVIGDVRIASQVHIAPGVSLRADEGMPFYIGKNVNIQDGAVIHGLEQGRVTGDDGEDYSVWIGENSSITHMAMVHGPAYVGNNCFIGFRSTVFNARVGDSCVVMSHALIENVEIPPGKYIASGSIIVMPEQAERLPNVKDSDTAFARHVISINQKLRQGYLCAEDELCLATLNHQQELNGSSHPQLSQEAQLWVRNCLAQGCQIGVERADERRLRMNSWSDCAAITSIKEFEVIKEISALLSLYPNYYLRLYSISPNNRSRLSTWTIQPQ